ncbi:hypothetical protein B0H34DRAFT_191762 [Crassisporium funariophilum]|nr:hypothetical protein B0H34DRAFT_191762 [Crassisporium funariophilum]
MRRGRHALMLTVVPVTMIRVSGCPARKRETVEIDGGTFDGIGHICCFVIYFHLGTADLTSERVDCFNAGCCCASSRSITKYQGSHDGKHDRGFGSFQNSAPKVRRFIAGRIEVTSNESTREPPIWRRKLFIVRTCLMLQAAPS